MDKPKKKPIRQNDDDFDNGYDTGYNVAHTEWEKYHHMVLHESNCEWYNKGLEAQKNIDERNELTEDEIEKVILDNKEIFIFGMGAKAIIKAIEEKQTRTCDPECPFCKTEEASK